MRCFARIAAAVLPLVGLSPVLAADVIPPAEVQNVRVTRSGANVVVTFNPVTTNINGAAQTPSLYRVHRGATPGYTVDKLGGVDLAGTTTSTTFTDTGEAANKFRNGFYLVTAVGPGGVEGNARPSKVTSPPSGLTSSFSTTGVTLNWTAASPSAAVAGYEVFYGGGSLNYSQHLDVGKVTSVGIPLDQSTPYYFSVYAYDSEHNYSAKSNETSGAITSGGGPTQVCGQLASNTTWTVSGSPYIVTCDVTVAGTGGPFITDAGTTVLTIQPGVIVKFAANTGLYIGSGANAGALNANGTSGSPILFTANQTFPTNGYWTGIQFTASTDAASTVVNNVVVEYAGPNTGAGAGITFTGNAATISNTQVTNSAHDGIYVTGSATPTLNNVTITNAARYGVRQDTPTAITISGMKQSAITSNGYSGTGAVSPTITNSTIDHGIYLDTPGATPSFTGNTFTRFADLTSRIGADDAGQLLTQNTLSGALPSTRLELLGERVSKNATWPNLGFPLALIYTTTYVYGDTATPVSLTLGAGLQLRFAAGIQLAIAYSTNLGRLIAQGTPSAPILFTADTASPAPGFWYGLYFDNGTTPDSVLDNVIVEYAGYGNNAAIRTNACNATLKNSTIRNGSYYGVSLGNPSSWTIDRNTFSGNVNYDLVISGVNTSVVTNNTFNASVYFDSAGSTYTFTGNTLNNYAAGTRPLRIGAHAVPALNTNTFNSPAAGSVIEVIGESIGTTATWPSLGFPWAIVTTSLSVNGDAVNTVTLTLPAGTTMKFGANLRLYVGNSGKAALVAQGSVAQPILFTSYSATPAPNQWYGLYLDTLTQPSTVLDRVIVEYSGVGNSPGVQFLGGVVATLTNSTIRNNGYYGIYLSGNAVPVVTGNTFTGNGYYDVYVNGSSNFQLSNNSLTNSAFFDTAGGTHAVTNNTFNNYGPAARPLRVGAHAVGQLNTNTFVSVGTNWIEVLGDTISANATWSVIGGMPYVLVSGDVYVYGDPVNTVTLTLPPGSKLKFNSGPRLVIGYQTNKGTLNATGTSVSTILFTTNNASPAPGQWYGLWFEPGATPTSIMDYCTVEYAGAGYSNGIRVNGSSPTIKRSTIRNGSAYGIITQSGANPVINANTFTGNANFDLSVSGATTMSVTGNAFGSSAYFDTAGSTYTLTGNTFNAYNNATRNLRVGAHVLGQLNTNTFVGVGSNAWVEVLGETISASATWANLGFPYVFVSGEVFVNGDTATNVTLTIAAGNTLKFGSSVRLVIGYQGQATLIAQGTVAQPILFTTSNSTPAAGQWPGLWFDVYAQPASVMDRCTVEYAGQSYNNDIRIIASSPTIKNSTIRNSSYYGIYGTYSGASYPAPLIQANTFSGNAQNDVFLEGGGATVTGNTFAHAIRFNSAAGATPLIQNNTFNTYLPPFQLRVPALAVNTLTGNTFAGFDATSDVEVIGDTITGTARWQKLAVPYDVVASYIYVSGTLTTPAQLTIDPGVTVRFTSNSYLYVGSSNTQGVLIANGTSGLPILFTTDNAAPAAGQWRGLYFDNGTTTPSSLQYVTVEYAGQSNYGAIQMYKSEVPLSNCTVRNVAYTGIWVQDGSPTIQNTTVLNAGYFGMRFDTTSATRTPQVTNCTVTTPANYGIAIAGAYSGTFSGNSLDNGLNVEGTGGTPVIQSNTLKNYGTYPLQVPASSLGSLTGNVFQGTTASSVIKVLADSINTDQTWAALAIPYDFAGITYIYRDITTPATVTINAGTTLKFGTGARLQIGYSSYKGALVANGTSGSPILFTTDTTPAAPGQWRGLYFDTNAVTSSLQYATIEYGGQYDNACLYSVNQSALTMTDSTIRNCNQYGAYLSSSSPTLRFDTFQNNTAYGVGLTSNALPVLQHNTFAGNTSGAINEQSSDRPDARLNFYSDPSGPGGSGPGTGQGVTANVVFEPWLNQAYTRLNYFKDVLSTTKSFHAGSFSRFYATLNETSNWALVFYDTGNNAVRNFSGSGSTVQVDFNGKDNSNNNLADGPYTYKFTATGTPSGNVAAAAQGSVSIKASLSTAEITNPLYNDSFSSGTVVSIVGTAANPNFSKYTLEYGARNFPSGWSSIVSNSTTQVTNGTLGSWNTAGLQNGQYSLRLTVTNTSAETTVVILPVNVLAINQLALDHAAFSPNNDGRIDTVTASATLSELADWTINVTNVATSEVVRTFTGTGINIVQVWDGKKQDGVTMAPEGNYRFDLTATRNGKNVAQSSSNTQLDITPPTATITSPANGASVYNAVPINGTALDPNGTFSSYLLEYGIGTSPLTYTQIGTTQTTPVNNGLLGTWSTSANDGSEPVANGGYRIRLTASDAAGNQSVASVQVTVDNLVLGQIFPGATTLNTYRGDVDPINFSVNKPATVTLKIYPEGPGDTGVIQKQSSGSFPPGQNAFYWDGKNGSGTVLPDEAYIYVLEADAGSGRTARFSPQTGQYVGAGSGNIPASYNTYTNQFWTMSYTISPPASRWSMQVTPSGGTAFYAHQNEPHEANTFNVIWDGRDPAGNIVGVTSYVYFPPPTTLRPNYVITTGDTPQVDNWNSDPYWIGATMSAVSRINFTLERDASVKITILPPGIANPSDASGRRIYGPTTLTPGDYSITFDPTDPTDTNRDRMLFSNEGPFTFAIETTNPTTGTYQLRRGVVNMYK